MIHAPERIVSERLVLRKPELGDARVILETYARDEEVTRYLTFRPDQSNDETLSFVHRALDCWENGTSFTWVIMLKQPDRLIGMIEARMDRWHANLGYVLARQYWNKGYMAEAVKAVVDWALAQPEILRVWAVCDVENAASARVLEKAGMQKEGVLRRWALLPNRSETPRDCLCYAKVK